MGIAFPLMLLTSQSGGLDPALAKHESTLQAAQSLTVKFTVQKLPAAAVEYTLVYGKPGSMRIESPATLIVMNETTVWTLYKTKNTYTELPVNESSLVEASGTDERFAWAAFFGKDRLKDAMGKRLGAKRSLRGHLVSELSFTRKDGKQTVTLFLDDKLGFARGAILKSGTEEIIVMASEASIGEGLPAETFLFAPPNGASKVENVAAGTTYAQVAEILNPKCAGCHNATTRSGGIDLSSHKAIVSGGRAVLVIGNSRASGMIRTMRSGRMPQGGPKLPDAEIDLIAKWIDEGAKE